MSSNSFHDQNNVATLIAVETDGVTLINLEASPSSHALDTSNGTSGTDNGPTQSRHDNNNVHIIMATSEIDGKTPVALYSDSSGNLLIQST